MLVTVSVVPVCVCVCVCLQYIVRVAGGLSWLRRSHLLKVARGASFLVVREFLLLLHGEKERHLTISVLVSLYCELSPICVLCGYFWISPHFGRTSISLRAGSISCSPCVHGKTSRSVSEWTCGLISHPKEMILRASEDSQARLRVLKKACWRIRIIKFP